MRERRLVWKIYPYFLLIVLFSVLALMATASVMFRRFYLEELDRDLQSRLRILVQDLSQRPLDPLAIDRLCKTLGPQTLSRVTVILPDGRVIGDSAEDPTRMDNHSDRPEIQAARAGNIGRSIRFSDTVRRRLLYLALPVVRENGMVGVARMARPVVEIDAQVRGVMWQIGWGGGGIALFAALACWVLARRISRPLEDLRLAAERYARGDFKTRVPVPDTYETAELVRTMNQMAADLDDRMRTVIRQRNEQRAVFSGMLEGVVATDREGRVIGLNPAAARWLDIDVDRAVGRRIQEVVRNPHLYLCLDEALLAGGQPIETEVILHNPVERVLQVRARSFDGAEGRPMGALMVLNDVTQIKRLETVRRDFIANLSHELKTPITAMKSYLETLTEDGGLDTLAPAGFTMPAEIGRVLGILQRQTDRLQALVEDLLSLSRIEHEADGERIVLTPAFVRPVLEAAVESCAAKAVARDIDVAVECPSELQADLNEALLAQAVENLIDNALKYSDAKTRVVVSAHKTTMGVSIEVRDQGIGIESQHLDRIFERFYRVDQARSRTLGGTGLGLAIVKHIALAHRGTVRVESRPGQGSVFGMDLRNKDRNV
jgi:two-component system phosphate regulon sensor histidine kinase PhoR